MTSKLEIDRVRVAVAVLTVNISPDLMVPAGRCRDATGCPGGRVQHWRVHQGVGISDTSGFWVLAPESGHLRL